MQSEKWKMKIYGRTETMDRDGLGRGVRLWRTLYT